MYNIIRSIVCMSLSTVLQDRDDPFFVQKNLISFLDISDSLFNDLLNMIDHVDFAIIADHFCETSCHVAGSSSNIYAFSTGLKMIFESLKRWSMDNWSWNCGSPPYTSWLFFVGAIGSFVVNKVFPIYFDHYIVYNLWYLTSFLVFS